MGFSRHFITFLLLLLSGDIKGQKAIKRTRYVISSHCDSMSKVASDDDVEIFPISGFADKSLVCIEYSMYSKVS